jgi:hypothetical protein
LLGTPQVWTRQTAASLRAELAGEPFPKLVPQPVASAPSRQRLPHEVIGHGAASYTPAAPVRLPVRALRRDGPPKEGERQVVFLRAGAELGDGTTALAVTRSIFPPCRRPSWSAIARPSTPLSVGAEVLAGYLVDWGNVCLNGVFHPTWLSSGVDPTAYASPPRVRVPVFVDAAPMGSPQVWIQLNGSCSFEPAAGGKIPSSATVLLPELVGYALVGLGVATLASPPLLAQQEQQEQQELPSAEAPAARAAPTRRR